MAQGLDKLLDAAGKVADTAVKATGTLVNKGRDKAEEMALRSRLGKLHRQLGALVYSLRKNDEENTPMIDWYVGEIDRVKAKIAALQAAGGERDKDVHVYGENGDDGVQEDTMFRDGGGD